MSQTWSAPQKQELDRLADAIKATSQVLSTNLPPVRPNQGKFIYIIDESKIAYSNGTTWVRVYAHEVLSVFGRTGNVVAQSGDYTAAQVGADPAGTAAAAIAAHVALADPHTQYADLLHTHVATDISDSTAVGRTLLTAVDAAAQRSALGLVIGTNVQAFDQDLADIAALAGVQGDVIFRNATQWQRLAAGTTGQFLRTNGASAGVTWGAPSLWASATAAQGAGFATDTYITGSRLVPGTTTIKAGTRLRMKFYATKTAAGTEAAIVRLRWGKAGTTADTAVATITLSAATAATDRALFELDGVFYVSGASATLNYVLTVLHSNIPVGVAGGVTNQTTEVQGGTTSAFNTTTANAGFGLSLNAGTSAAWTLNGMQVELTNIA